LINELFFFRLKKSFFVWGLVRKDTANLVAQSSKELTSYVNKNHLGHLCLGDLGMDFWAGFFGKYGAEK